ncbi:hypothetical protein N9N03_00050 [Chlamydiia bacterium]|nr:hypothetical protein [Chlamydiia bacterium]
MKRNTDRYAKNVISDKNHSQTYSTQWPLTYDYHQCDQCGYIIETRFQYRERGEEYSKDVHCERCGHINLVEKSNNQMFGE